MAAMRWAVALGALAALAAASGVTVGPFCVRLRWLLRGERGLDGRARAGLLDARARARHPGGGAVAGGRRVGALGPAQCRRPRRPCPQTDLYWGAGPA